MWSSFDLSGTAETGTPHDAFWAGVTAARDDNLPHCAYPCPNAASGSVYGIWARKDSETVFNREGLDSIHKNR